MPFDAVLLTCEHGGNQVPAAYRELFQGAAARRALESHRGYDIGALEVARQMRSLLDVPLLACRDSRLVVDLNRSIGHAGLFSEFSTKLAASEREHLIRTHYTPHRTLVEETITAAAQRRACTLHLAIHSFTGTLNSQVRNADLGLLYDPARSAEQSLCLRWQAELVQKTPAMRIRRNYPYRGNADGLTTALRKRFPAKLYLGIEIELNQDMLTSGREPAPSVAKTLVRALQAIGALR